MVVTEQTLARALEDLADAVEPVDFVPHLRVAVPRRRRRRAAALIAATALVITATAGGLLAASLAATSHRTAGADAPGSAPHLDSHGQATLSATIDGDTYGPPHRPAQALPPETAYARAWCQAPVPAASSAFLVLAHLSTTGMNSDAWLVVYNYRTAPHTVVVSAVDGRRVTEFSTNLAASPLTVLGSSDDEQGGVSAQLEYEKFLAWMRVHHPDVPITSHILTSRYHVEFLNSQPGTLKRTRHGLVVAVTGKRIASRHAMGIGKNFTPSSRVVRDCRAHPKTGNCGIWLAIADGHFHPHGGHRWHGIIFYSPAQIKAAVTAAGYTWKLHG
jgi:hypothetical protein